MVAGGGARRRWPWLALAGLCLVVAGVLALRQARLQHDAPLLASVTSPDGRYRISLAPGWVAQWRGRLAGWVLR